MYNYKVKLELQRADIKVDFLKIADNLIESAEEFSDAPKKNKKTISDIKVYENYITLNLSSEAYLDSVGRALRGYTCLVLENNEALLACTTPSGSLFKYSLIADNKEAEEEIKISDSELIKALIDYVTSNRDTNSTIYRRKRNAIEKMKNIAIEAGLIKK